MKTTLYLARHGETDYNRAPTMQPRRNDARLNRVGRAQASALANRLSETPLDAIYTSSLIRARETALAVAAFHPEASFEEMDDLQEMSWGIHDGTAPGADIEEAYARWRTGDYDHAVEEGESILDVQVRALRAIERIVQREEGNAVLVVTHGRFLRVLLASILEEYGLGRMEDIAHANTGLYHLEFDGRRFEALRLNCTIHLTDASNVSVN